ncbi:adaptor protein MecA [Vagococcus xieshaowenii]|uniref:Adapter protein MecA n=1 Tax=Vagococcus xieshaowenii TaxID=2562451 RepID=A0A4Z0D7Q2_9ENTE|nr:adaptor protein MecA [Vagococcus xieshaowenii]QCA29108.1 adaptor protein MecA [Vagococcus xieshaowenii]TFZ40916.1 adaptor protein MecA [Vagococcus xieshaowenii]
MEMERINENTIRVLIENADLEARGVSFLDLLGNHKEIENFFYSILEEVDIDEQFQETDAVTFQVLPNRNGLELFISKNLMMSAPEDDSDDLDEFEEETSFADFIKKQFNTAQETKNDDNTNIGNIAVLDYVFEFLSFEDLIRMVDTYHFEDNLTDLYVLNHRYYLSMKFLTKLKSDRAIKNDIACILEFGHISPKSPELLKEYGQLIMKDDALEQVKHYFK